MLPKRKLFNHRGHREHGGDLVSTGAFAARMGQGKNKNSASRLARFLFFSANPTWLGSFDELAPALSPFGLHSCSLPRTCPWRSVVPIWEIRGWLPYNCEAPVLC